MNFKKRVNGSWTDIPYYVHNTSTDTITTLPAVIYPNAATATVGLKGQMVQSSTPSPTTPIQPQECGDLTGNLFDKNTTPVSLYYQTTRKVITQTAGVVSIIMPVSPNTKYTFNNPAGNRNRICETETVPEIDDTVINYITSDGNVSITLTTSNNTHYILWWVGYQQTYSDIKDTLSVNLGSTPLPYEPYGYKIPISSGGTTTPVYLGEVQTTRKVKKLVLTGEENWKYSTSSQVHWIENVPNDYDNTLISRITTVCTHYKCIQNNTGFSGMVNGNLRLYAKETSPIAHELYIKDETYTSAADFKAYLAAQYAAGTPVTVWYVLATETTGIVNEPIRKIGTYADEVSGITIPTITGKDSFDVLTTLKPSEVELTYTGWHDVTVKEWDGSDWQ